MDTYLDEKYEHQQEYKDKIKAIATGKTVKIRVTKKKRPSKETISDKKPSEIPASEIPASDKEPSEIPASDKEPSEIPASDTIVVTGRLNEKLATLFDELSTFMTKRGEPFKSRAYQKAQESIVLYENDIIHENYKDLNKLPGIGETIITKIGEYIQQLTDDYNLE